MIAVWKHMIGFFFQNLNGIAHGKLHFGSLKHTQIIFSVPDAGNLRFCNTK